MRGARLGDFFETSYGVILSDKFRKVNEDEILLGLRGAMYGLRGIPTSEASASEVDKSF